MDAPLHHAGRMIDLVADRFVPSGRAWLDITSGLAVALLIEPAGTMAEQFAWSLRCETLANLRHDLLNPLVDFGTVDRDRRFEAYARYGPIGASGRAAERVIAHAVQFLRAHDMGLGPPAAALALRPVVAGPAVGRRPLGVVLQPRAAYGAALEALDTGAPAGIAMLRIAGAPHSGLRTLRVLVARAARLHGYAPVDAALGSRLPDLADLLACRHVCVLADEGTTGSAASLLARLGATSARRHLVITFVRPPGGRAVHLERMGIAAMTTMIHFDRAGGPAPDEIFAAARDADGRPGLFLARLAGLRLDAPPPTPLLVRETAPAYGTPPEPAGRVGTRRFSDVLVRAETRAAQLARSGRHTRAARLLARAVRVLASRGAHDEAAACAVRLGVLRLDRGVLAAAAEAFLTAQQYAASDGLRVWATIGIGDARLLEGRLPDAEAAFRSAYVVARETGLANLRPIAAGRLAECLCRQLRYDEAEVALDEERGGTGPEGELARTRSHLARGRIPAATAASERAMGQAERTGDPKALALASEAVARARTACGDRRGAEQALVAGLRVARDAHLAVLALRLSIVHIELLGRSRGAAPHPRRLPPILRADLDAARTRPAFTTSSGAPSDIESLLVLAQAAEDDKEAVERVCEAVLRQAGARSMLVLSASPDARQLALAGHPWPGEPVAALRVLNGEARVRADPSVHPCQSAEPVRYGGELVAAIACHFAASTPFHPERTADLLRAAALAVAPGVRGLLDRAASRTPGGSAGDLLGGSVVTCALRDAVARAARAPFPVLIEGESGSGKELVARAIHRLSPRRERRFCAVNCAALTDDLLEAELFGHARGAYTGAVGERAGLFEDADSGTLFLDEVGELSARAQAKLLRVLQDGEVRRVGENVARRVDVRIVAATNRRLEAEVEAGGFRADLRFRLDVVRLEVPPLRRRADDVPLLAAKFWAEAAARVGSQATLTPETLLALARYDWPGNVRELQNVMAWVAVHSPRRGRIGPPSLPAHVAAMSQPTATTFEAARQEFEKRFIKAALASANGQRGRAAEALGVSRQGLGKMMARLHIDAP